MKPHEPGPPLLFTMIMKAMVMPRATSRESKRLDREMPAGLDAVEGEAMVAGLVMEFTVMVEPNMRDMITLRGLGGDRQA